MGYQSPWLAKPLSTMQVDLAFSCNFEIMSIHYLSTSPDHCRTASHSLNRQLCRNPRAQGIPSSETPYLADRLAWTPNLLMSLQSSSQIYGVWIYSFTIVESYKRCYSIFVLQMSMAKPFRGQHMSPYGRAVPVQPFTIICYSYVGTLDPPTESTPGLRNFYRSRWKSTRLFGRG